MGKTRELFKKIRDTKGTFHAKKEKVKSLSHVWLFATSMNGNLPGPSIHGIFQARILEWVAISTIKDRNGMELTEAEDIKKRWQEYTEELYKKDLHDPDNHKGVITHLEPEILECEVKWRYIRSITMNKASGGDSSWAISNLKRWCCKSATINMSANLENSAVATGLEKVSFHSNPKERLCQRMFKLPYNCTHLTH